MKEEKKDDKKPSGVIKVLTPVITQNTVESLLNDYNVRVANQAEGIRNRDDALSALNKEVRDLREDARGLKKETEGLKAQLGELKEKHPEIFDDKTDETPPDAKEDKKAIEV